MLPLLVTSAAAGSALPAPGARAEGDVQNEQALKAAVCLARDSSLSFKAKNPRAYGKGSDLRFHQ